MVLTSALVNMASSAKLVFSYHNAADWKFGSDWNSYEHLGTTVMGFEVWACAAKTMKVEPPRIKWALVSPGRARFFFLYSLPLEETKTRQPPASPEAQLQHPDLDRTVFRIIKAKPGYLNGQSMVLLMVSLKQPVLATSSMFVFFLLLLSLLLLKLDTN